MADETNVTITPILHYRDLDKALTFLADAFGFRQEQVHRDDDGNLVYAIVELGGCYLGVGPTSDEDGPFNLGGTGVYVALDDPDAHHDRAAAAGAEIVMGLVDQEYGSREYAARDPEGNVWAFGTYRPGPA